MGFPFGLIIGTAICHRLQFLHNCIMLNRMNKKDYYPETVLLPKNCLNIDVALKWFWVLKPDVITLKAE